MVNKISQKIKGGLLGVAIGDALGFPFEGLSREEMASKSLDNYSSGPYPPGTWSDDTSLTFCTVESLLERGFFDPDDLAQRFRLWFKEGHLTPFGQAIGFGRTTTEAIRRYLSGTPALLCGGRDERSNGNGSLMRILPVAIFYTWQPLEAMLEAVHQASKVTHAHPRSQMACGFYALLVRGLLRPSETLSEPGREEAYRRTVSLFLDFYRLQREFAPELIHFDRLLSLGFGDLPQKEIKSRAYVIHTLEAAVWCLLRGQNFMDTLSQALRLGGDTDTIGAVTGGLAGIFWGLEQIPLYLVEGLVKSGKLVALSEKFAERVEVFAYAC